MYRKSLDMRRFIRENMWEDVALLLDEKPGLVNFNYIDGAMLNKGKTPLFLTVELCLNGSCDIQWVDYLLRKGADPNKSNLYEGCQCTPLYLCTTTPVRMIKVAYAVATMLLSQGSNVNMYDLFENSIRRMISNSDDYDETMVKFMCVNGAYKRQLQRGLLLIISLQLSWVPKVVDCLLEHGTEIFNPGNTQNNPSWAAKFFNTPGADLIHRAENLIDRAKQLKNVERAVHHDTWMDTYPLQWRPYIYDFNTLLRTIQRNERNVYLAMKHPSSNACVLPGDIFKIVMLFVTSSTASRRVGCWLSPLVF